MRLFLVLIFLIGAMPCFVAAERLPKPWPTALERFVKHHHTQIVSVTESARFSGTNRANDQAAWIKVAAIFARNHHTHPTEMRGIWFEVSDADTEDNLYLPIARVHALQKRLAGLEETAGYFARRNESLAVLGTEDCRPSMPLPRTHKLCVGLYQRIEDSGVAISTDHIGLFLKAVELADFADSIDSALAILEQR